MAVHNRASADPVSLFLKKNTFRCKPLNANLSPDECVERQLREVETKMFGRRITVNNAAPDKYCRSGCCQQGLVFLKKMRYKAWVARMRERRETKTPCQPFGHHKNGDTIPAHPSAT